MRSVCRADNFTTFMCRLSLNLRASTSRNPLGLSRTVMGLLVLYTHIIILCLKLIATYYAAASITLRYSKVILQLELYSCI
jgi:hypothetical protein